MDVPFVFEHLVSLSHCSNRIVLRTSKTGRKEIRKVRSQKWLKTMWQVWKRFESQSTSRWVWPIIVRFFECMQLRVLGISKVSTQMWRAGANGNTQVDSGWYVFFEIAPFGRRSRRDATIRKASHLICVSFTPLVLGISKHHHHHRDTVVNQLVSANRWSLFHICAICTDATFFSRPRFVCLSRLLYYERHFYAGFVFRFLFATVGTVGPLSFVRKMRLYRLLHFSGSRWLARNECVRFRTICFLEQKRKLDPNDF